MSNNRSDIELIYPKFNISLSLPLMLYNISAGFPSPANDYIEKSLDLNEHLIQHPEATFFVKVTGDSMIDAGIHAGDILIVDKSLKPKNKSIIVAVIGGEFTVKRYIINKGRHYLKPDNSAYPITEITGDEEFCCWGVVTNIIHKCL